MLKISKLFTLLSYISILVMVKRTNLPVTFKKSLIYYITKGKRATICYVTITLNKSKGINFFWFFSLSFFKEKKKTSKIKEISAIYIRGIFFVVRAL